MRATDYSWLNIIEIATPPCSECHIIVDIIN